MATSEIPQHHGRPMTIVGARVRCGVCGFESPVPPGGLEDPAPKHCGRTMHAVRHLRCDVCGEETSDTLLLETPDTLYAPPPSPAAPPAEVADLVGEDWAGYRVVSKLGQGGMAVVYKAHQPSLNRYVAIKLLVPHGPPDPGLIQRFRQEAQLIAGLRHPNIVTVLDFGEEQGLPYLVMEFVEGETLAARMGRPLEVSAALAIAAQIGRALHYAHGEGVVHRDVKPSNVLLRGEDWALLSDFGIAKVLGSPLNLTQTGTAIGTPEYMAPEQCQGLGVDARSDIYSLGVVLYEMLTGRPPFTGDTPMSVMLKHVHEPPPPARTLNSDLPREVEPLLSRALAKDPGARFASAGELVEALQPGAPVRPAPGRLRRFLARRPRALVLWDAGAVLLAAVAVITGLRITAPGGLPELGPSLGQIAFASDRDGNPEIYVMDADGSGVKRLTDNRAEDFAPTWSPDGTKIAFVTDRDRAGLLDQNSEIYVMDADGSGVKRLTDHPSLDHDPAWSPDGTKIAFTSRRDGKAEIYVMNADGSAVTRLTDGGASDPAWCFDEGKTKVAFESDRDNPRGLNSDIYIMNADGSEVKRITNGPEIDREPSCSSLGFSIAFTRIPIRPGAPQDEAENPEIFVMGLDGSNVQRLTRHPGSDEHPSRSTLVNDPGSGIPFEVIAFVSDRDGNSEIYAMILSGSSIGVTRLTDNPAFDGAPAWPLR